MIDFEIRLMKEADLDLVCQLEISSHSHPWTIGNFLDSIKSGYWCYVLVSKASPNEILGHAVLMPGVDELHLLNITVSERYRRQKIAYRTLLAMEPIAKAHSMGSIFLEVRQSNYSAIQLYQSLDYHELSVRKNYYASNAQGNAREDAIVMVKKMVSES